MKIGILEWICGGGFQETEPSLVAESLLNEGWAMLNAVAQDFASCGNEVTAAIDRRSVERLRLSDLESRFQVEFNSGFSDGLPSSWWKIASEVDALVVIAPEFSGILQTAISKLIPVSKLLLNCCGDFLARSCDKWLTAHRLSAAGIMHPATRLATDATESWLQQHRNESGMWFLKPRDGAGCDAIQLVSDVSVRDALRMVRSEDSNSKILIQPLHNGAAFSRSAIVDVSGRAHWMPLVTQEFTVAESMVYSGGQVLTSVHSPYEDRFSGKRYSIDRLDEVLNKTAEALGQGALGWVGVDLLYSYELDDWMVIEVNPRLTTSFAGLSMSHGPGLMGHMLRAGQGLEVTIEPTWKSIAFDSAGNER